MSVESYIKNNIKKLGNKVYVVPEIPEKKLNNAILSIAPNINQQYVLALIDSTVFGSAKEGLIFTGEGIYKKYSFEKRQEYRFENIIKAEYQVTKINKNNGKVEEKEHIFLQMNDNSKIELSSCYMMNVNYQELVKLINGVINEAGEDKQYVATLQNLPLESMDNDIKDAYIKIICNFAYSDDNEIDSKEYSEIISLIVRINYNSDNRLKIRKYMCDVLECENTEDLIQYLNNNVPEGSLDVIKKSLIKDMIYIYKIKNNIDRWKENSFIVNLQQEFNIEDNQVEVMIRAIKNDEETLSMRKNDKEVEKAMKDLVAKAGAVGVPLAAIYFSGSVVGMSAAGITSGLATLGMGGVLGFSGMVTGIGVVVLLGIGAYKGIKRVTGISDLENNKQREIMLQSIIKNSQKSLDYLIEDVNEISTILMNEMAKGVESSIKIKKLSALLSMMSKGAKEVNTKINYAEKESIMTHLPSKLDITRLNELTNGPTKQKLREYIMACYNEQEFNSNGENYIEFILNDKLSLNEFENLYSYFEEIGYTNVSDAALASAKGAAKNLVKNVRGKL